LLLPHNGAVITVTQIDQLIILLSANEGLSLAGKLLAPEVGFL
jgi:hypothetical protein